MNYKEKQYLIDKWKTSENKEKMVVLLESQETKHIKYKVNYNNLFKRCQK